MRVLVTDDSAFMRKMLSLIIGSERGFTVVDVARNGQEALEKIEKLKPDIMTLDIEMPIMDGLTTLENLKAMPAGTHKPLVLVCSTLTVAGSEAALRALRLGAADFITKDPMAVGAGDEEIKKELIGKLRGITHGRAAAAVAMKRAAMAGAGAGSAGGNVPSSIDLSGRPIDLVVIGSSTGGPPVLEEIITQLPEDFAPPVVIAQHMPLLFTQSLANRLHDMSDMKVVHGAHGMTIEKGTVTLLPGGIHSRLRRTGGRMIMECSAEPKTELYKPSANELFGSAAVAVGGRGLGIMLTGMGDDGERGARALHAAGSPILTQSAATCAVYGMPRAVVDAGASSAAMDPKAIGQTLVRWAASMRTPSRLAV